MKASGAVPRYLIRLSSVHELEVVIFESQIPGDDFGLRKAAVSAFD